MLQMACKYEVGPQLANGRAGASSGDPSQWADTGPHVCVIHIDSHWPLAMANFALTLHRIHRLYRLDRQVRNCAPIGARGAGEQQGSCYGAAMHDSLQAGHELWAASAGKPGDR